MFSYFLIGASSTYYLKLENKLPNKVKFIHNQQGVEMDGEIDINGIYETDSETPFSMKLIYTNEYCTETTIAEVQAGTTQGYTYSITEDKIPARCKPLTGKQYLYLRNPTQYTLIITIDGQKSELRQNGEFTKESDTPFTATISIKNEQCDVTKTFTSIPYPEYHIVSEADIPDECKPPKGMQYLNLKNPTQYTLIITIDGKTSELRQNGKYTWESNTPFTATISIKNEQCDVSKTFSSVSSPDFYVISENDIPTECILESKSSQGKSTPKSKIIITAVCIAFVVCIGIAVATYFFACRKSPPVKNDV